MGTDHLGCAPQLITEARDAQERLKRGNAFNDWMIYGGGVVACRTEAMTAARTNTPLGRRYCEEMGAVLKEQGLDGIDKGTRSCLLKVMERRNEIEAWLATVKIKKRLKLNHPQTVLSAWKRATTEKPKVAEPKIELVAAWKNATPEEHRAALDAGGIDLLLAALSPAMREGLEHLLANPHARQRLAEKNAEEQQAVKEAKDGVTKRCPQRGTLSAPEPVKSRKKPKPAPMKDIGQWKKFDLEALRAAIVQEQRRSVYDERDKGGLTQKEFRRLDAMKNMEKVLAKAAASKVKTVTIPRSNGNDVPPDESSETMKLRHAAAEALTGAVPA